MLWMLKEAIIQGRRVSSAEVEQIRTLLARNPVWHRTRLSRELCAQWQWRNGAGRLKDMACRTLLLKLQNRGWIQLPPRQGASVNGRRNRLPAPIAVDERALLGPLGLLRPLRVDVARAGSPESMVCQGLLQRYHYLGHGNAVGENLRYLVRERQGRPVACLVFGSAAWRCQPRDAFIGWTSIQREQRLPWVTNNTRFLILPWVQTPHLASHLLSLITRRLSRDWQAKYGHPVDLVETFVERARFAGICYQAAGWQWVGTTTGRGRNSSGLIPQGPIKEVYLRPVCADFRAQLCA